MTQEFREESGIERRNAGSLSNRPRTAPPNADRWAAPQVKDNVAPMLAGLTFEDQKRERAAGRRPIADRLDPRRRTETMPRTDRRRPSRIAWIWGALLLAGIPARGTDPIDPDALGPEVTSLALAPSAGSILVGGTLQLSAVATFDDGSTRDVTSDPGNLLQDFPQGAVSIDASGLVSALAPADVVIIATHDTYLSTAVASLALAVRAAGDRDGDGLSDADEVAHQLDPDFAGDAGADLDQDGLSNAGEVTRDTDLRKADTDGDFTPDGLEAAAGTDPLVSDLTPPPPAPTSNLDESCVVSVLTLSLLGASPCAGRERSHSSSPSVFAALVPERPNFSVFQPVKATLVITNRTSEPLVASINLKEELRFLVKGPDGLTKHVELPPSAGGIWIPTEIEISAGGEFRTSLLLNEWIRFEEVGPYEIAVSVNSATSKSGRTLAEQGPTCTIEIVPADAKILKEECRETAEEAMTPNAEAADRASRALSFMRHEVCIGDLARVLQDSFHGKEGAIKALVGIGTEAAFQVLVERWDSLRWEQQALARSEAFMKGLGQRLDDALMRAGKKNKEAFADGSS